jgi:hypothetical protein
MPRISLQIPPRSEGNMRNYKLAIRENLLPYSSSYLTFITNISHTHGFKTLRNIPHLLIHSLAPWSDYNTCFLYYRQTILLDFKGF